MHLARARVEAAPAARVGPLVEIDLSQQELRRLGQAVHIEPQVFDLIVHLVRNHDRIVSKDELIDTIWNGRIISEAALSSRINGARRALGEVGQQFDLAPASRHCVEHAA